MFQVLFAHPWLTFLLLCVLPFCGVRIAIPASIFLFGIKHLATMTSLAIVISIAWGIFLFLIIDYWIALGKKTPGLRGFFSWWENGVKKKANKIVQNYGIFSLALLLALPVPNVGVYSGSLLSHFLGYKFRDYFIGLTFGLLCCGFCIALLSLVLYVIL